MFPISLSRDCASNSVERLVTKTGYLYDLSDSIREYTGLESGSGPVSKKKSLLKIKDVSGGSMLLLVSLWLR